MEKQLYQEMYEIEEKHWWFVGRRKILFDITKLEVGKAGKIGKVLDIGCGTGFNAKWLGELREREAKFTRLRCRMRRSVLPRNVCQI